MDLFDSHCLLPLQSIPPLWAPACLGHKSAGGKQLQKELKKLESSVNYNRKEGEFSEGWVHRGKGIVFK